MAYGLITYMDMSIITCYGTYGKLFGEKYNQQMIY